MEWYNLLVQNKDLIKIIYGAIISLICFTIVLKSDRLYRLSLHNGIRYFRNAFFFYSLAFVVRYILGYFFYSYGLTLLFEFFLITAGFFLLHSLLWKNFYYIEKPYLSSLFSPVTILFYLMAGLLVFLDYLWCFYLFLFLSQIFIFISASIISYRNYISNRNKAFPRFYFLAMLLSLFAWILNILAAMVFDWHKGIMINAYLLNIIVFILFLFGVIKIANR